uniref:IGFBP N-terminal domain-containing protein n=1 Tax=Eptatretus burgeri TaxID=7764 RepID=A0A8C4N3V7_EPTBU
MASRAFALFVALLLVSTLRVSHDSMSPCPGAAALDPSRDTDAPVPTVGETDEGEAAASPVRCSACDATERARCNTPSACELIREPGCGCCWTCARAVGEPCGIYTERCGSGLRCLPPLGNKSPILALINGRGTCLSGSTYDPDAGGSRSTSKEVSSEEPHANTTTSSPSLPVNSHIKGYSHRLRIIAISPSTSNTLLPKHQHVSPIGPCRQDLEKILELLQKAPLLNPKTVHLPNCDKRGFYKSKQVGQMC